jgi:hypothetical protein
MTRPTFPEQTGPDTLKYSSDLWWFFHEADKHAGLKSSQGAIQDVIELGAEISAEPDEPIINLHEAKRMRRLFAILRLVPEHHYGVLRVWYTNREQEPAETKVAAAHKAFYAAAKRQVAA